MLVDNQTILLLVMLILLVYGLVTMLEVCGFREELRHLLKNGSLRTPALTRPKTALGLSLFDCLEAIRYRLTNTTILTKPSSKKLENSALDILDKLETLPQFSGREEEVYFNALLEHITHDLGVHTTAIVFESFMERGTTIAPKVICNGVSGSRFERQLLEMLFDAGRYAPHTFHDGFISESRFGDFCLFDIRYSIYFPFSYRREGTLKKGVLWFGYGCKNSPSFQTVEQGTELARRIERELVSLGRFTELSGKVKEVQNLEKERREIVAHVSHDIRSPLSTIKSILKLFETEDRLGEHKKFLDVAFRNCDKLKSMVEDLLDYSRLHLGGIKKSSQCFSLKEVVEEVVQDYETSAKFKALSLVAVLGKGPYMVEADRAHISRILGNIVSNAIKYTEHGEVKVVLQYTDNCQTCVLSVQDTGVGMTQEEMEKLFTPFTRFQRVGNEEGIGLGLTISKALVELNDGMLLVNSSSHGSEFQVKLPSINRNKSLNESSMTTKAYTQKITQKFIILILDDDHDCVGTLAQILEAQGHEIRKAYSVVEAMGILNFDPPQVLITDSSMPQGGGKRVLEFVRKLKQRIQLIVLTGNAGEINDYVTLGAHKVFFKPVDMSEILIYLENLNLMENNEEKVALVA